MLWILPSFWETSVRTFRSASLQINAGWIGRVELVLTALLKCLSLAESAISSLVINNSKPLDSTFQQTRGGQLGPYKAALFNVPNCALPPNLADVGDVNKVSDVLKQYLFRVGDDGTCLYDPNFLGICNPPLAPDTTYRYNSYFLQSEY